MTPRTDEAVQHKHVRTEVMDGVGIITLNRPEKLNALTAQMYAVFNAATRRFEKDDAVGAMMIVSSGRAFCAGADLEMVRAAQAGIGDTSAMDLDMLDPASITKPILCGVVGACVGEGFAMAISSDLVIAGTSARFLIPEVGIGVSPVDIPLWAAGRLSPNHILEAILTADWKDAAWAERVGLVNSTCSDEDVWETTFDMARKIAGAPLAVTTLVKSLVREAHSTTNRSELRQRGAAARMRILDDARMAQGKD